MKGGRKYYKTRQLICPIEEFKHKQHLLAHGEWEEEEK
jgi:hypothetical protein